MSVPGLLFENCSPEVFIPARSSESFPTAAKVLVEVYRLFLLQVSSDELSSARDPRPEREMSGHTVPVDFSGHMLDLDEDEDLEVFSKVQTVRGGLH